MKAVNLIPAEERRAVRGQGGGPALSTRLLLGGLGVAVVGVTVLVLVSNQINSKQDELAEIQTKQQNAVAATEALRPYGDFVSLQQARYSTVKGIASSRFNWERIVRQLSRVVPPKVWIMDFKGTVSKDTASGGEGGGGGGGGGSLRGSIAGPAVELKGCAPKQSDSARLMVRLRNIDGVESVVMTKSASASQEQTGGGGGAAPAPSSSTSEDSGGCPKLEFEMIVAFRAGGAIATGGAATPEAAAQTTAAGTTGATGATGTTGATGATTAGAGK